MNVIRYCLVFSFVSAIIKAENTDKDTNHVHFGFVKDFDLITYSFLSIKDEPNVLMGTSHNRINIQRSPSSLDSFLLEFKGHGYTFCMFQEPSMTLLHPNIEMVYSDGTSMPTLDVLPFKGYVVSYFQNNEEKSFASLNYRCSWDAVSIKNDDKKNWARFVVYRNANYTSATSSKISGVGQEYVTPIFEGSFMLDNELFTVKEKSRYSSTKKWHDKHFPSDIHSNVKMILIKSSDIKHELQGFSKESLTNHEFCGVNSLEYNRNKSLEIRFNLRKNLFGSSENDVNYQELHKRQVSGCPVTKKIIYMVAVMDCTYISVHGSESAARAKVIDNWNLASSIYEQELNVYLGLTKIIAMSTCEVDLTQLTKFNRACSSSYTITDRLSDFSQWRGSSQDSTAGLFHLMSNCSTGATVGLAWLGELCETKDIQQSDGTHVSGTAVSTIVTNEFMVVSHEIGHNFGAEHDCTSSLCSSCTPNPRCSDCCPCQDNCDCRDLYIMNPTNDVSPVNPTFSFCSRYDICTNFPKRGTCVVDLGSQKISILNSGICGNGVKEGNEQCDCGGSESCANDKCCFQNCTLKAGSVCSDKNNECCNNCLPIPKNATKVCRPTASDCDVPEYCLGDSDCPNDLYKDDGTSCNNSTVLYCASGLCTNRDQQCIALSGSQETISGACADYLEECQMFCETALSGCRILGSQFRDGTSCGNGRCYNGACSDSTIISKVAQWFFDNQRAALAVLITVVLVLLCAGNFFLKNLKAEKDNSMIRKAKLEQRELDKLSKYEKQKRAEMKNKREELSGLESKRASRS